MGGKKQQLALHFSNVFYTSRALSFVLYTSPSSFISRVCLDNETCQPLMNLPLINAGFSFLFIPLQRSDIHYDRADVCGLLRVRLTRRDVCARFCKQNYLEKFVRRQLVKCCYVITRETTVT